MAYELNGRVALITGATGGIGSAISKKLYEQGAEIVITGRSIDKLNTLSEQITVASPKNTRKPFCVPLDLTALDAAETLINNTINQFKRIDILVNNAGLIQPAYFLKTDKALLEKVLLVNYIVPFFLCQHALKQMTKNRYGRIINITSAAGYMGDAGLSAYAGSKGALAASTKSIAAEYGKRGITANCIAPGVIDTEPTHAMTPEYVKTIKNQIPLHKFGQPEDVATTVAFLASEEAKYINGQQIHVNGGLIR